MSVTSSAIRIVGIDFGTQSCTLAVSGNRGVDVLVTETGDRSVPTTVTFTSECRHVGDSSAAASRPASVLDAKRLLGLPYGSPAWERESIFCNAAMQPAEDGTTQIRMQSAGEDLWLQPEQIVAPIFRRLRTVAEFAAQQELRSHLPVPEAVVSVPCFYTESQRARLIQAASVGEVTVLCTMNDTAAAALDYGLFKTAGFETSQSSHVAFVSMGHSSATCALVHFTAGRAEVLNHAFDEQLGGRDFDRVLFDLYTAKILEKYKMDVRTNLKAKHRLLTACNRLKVLLSGGTEHSLSLECLMDDRDVVFPPLGKAEFVALCEPLLRRVDGMAKRLLRMDLLTNIDSVEVFGGTSRIPCVQDVLQEAFGCKLSHTLSADAVARGCSIMGAILNPNKHVPYTLVDRAAHHLTYSLNSALSPLYDIPASTWPILIPPLLEPRPLTVLYEETAFWHEHTTNAQQLIVGQWNLQAGKSLHYSIEVLPDGRLGLACRTDDGAAPAVIVAPNFGSSSVPADVLQAWRALEKRLQEIDATVLAKAETRNAIESMVYNTRPDLEDSEKHPVYRHLSTSEKSTLLDALQNAESWLYGDAESADLQELRERWGDLQALFETITGPYEQQVRQELLKEQAATLQSHIADRLAILTQFLESPDRYSILTENECTAAARFVQNTSAKCAAVLDPVTDAIIADLTQLLDTVEGYVGSLHYKRAAKVADPTSPKSMSMSGEPLALPSTDLLGSFGSSMGDGNYARKYETICSRRGVKCNSGLLKQLLAEVPSSIDLGHNFVGAKGALAVVELVKTMPSVTALNLSGNSLDNDSIHALVKELRDHPALTSLDLSENPISVVAGQTLVKFVTQNPRIVKLNVEGTLMMKSQKENLLKLVARNAGTSVGTSR
eukprot:EG_transcript_2358